MFQILVYILGFSFVLCGYRLIRGPTIADRLLALDLIFIVVMGLFCFLYLQSSYGFYLELTMIVALVGFVSTLAFCRAILQRRNR